MSNLPPKKPVPWDEIEIEVLPIVQILNDAGIYTFSSCSGHGRHWPFVRCYVSDKYGESDIIDVLTKNGYYAFTIQHTRYIYSKADPYKGKPFWHLEFWKQE